MHLQGFLNQLADGAGFGGTSKLISLFQIDNPAICEVMGVEEQDYIHSSYVINAERKIVNRPIEDQKPYIDREIFMKEMIIKPIDQ